MKKKKGKLGKAMSRQPKHVPVKAEHPTHAKFNKEHGMGMMPQGMSPSGDYDGSGNRMPSLKNNEECY